jgi:hypothetical protein
VSFYNRAALTWSLYLSAYLHVTVIKVFQPFLASPSRTTHLRSFANPRATPEAICAASINQLKRLLLVYRLQSKLGLFSVLIHTAILYVANAMVHEASSAIHKGVIGLSGEWQFYLDLCIAGNHSLFGSFRAFGTLTKGIMAMALRHGVITPRKAKRVARDLRELGAKYDVVKDLGNGRAETVAWIVDHDLGTIDPERAAGGALADEFQKLMLHDDTETQE